MEITRQYNQEYVSRVRKYVAIQQAGGVVSYYMTMLMRKDLLSVIIHLLGV